MKDILSLLSCTILFGAYSIAQEDATAVVSLQAAEVLYQSQGEDLKERIASDSLANFLSVDLVSLLEETTSIWVNSYGKNGAASPVFRGTSAAHTQVYWNGVNINSATLGQSDLRTVRLGAGQVVSVNPGLQSLNDGSGGLGGSIHVNDVLKFIISHLNKTDENQEYDVGSGYGLKALDIMNFYKSIFKGNFKGQIKKHFTNCFKAKIPINNVLLLYFKIKIQTID